MSTEKEFDSALTLQDKIRLELNRYGQKEVPLTVAELASNIGITRNYDAYQALVRLKRAGEIDFQKDDNKIIGIVVHKLEPSGRTYQRAAERVKTTTANRITQIHTENPIEGMTALKEYLNKKLAILDMQQRAREAGLDAETTVVFEPNPLAEEGLALLNLLSDTMDALKETRQQLEMTQYDLEAEKRNVNFLQRNKRESTRRELIATAAAN